MTKTELIQNTQEYMTSTYGIPIKLRPEEISNRIDDAHRYFRLEYERAVEEKYYIIPDSYFSTEEFKEKRTIQMPKCVVSVTECKLLRGGLQWGYNDRDFSMNKIFAADVFLGSFTSDDLILRTAYMSQFDLARAMIKEHVNYNYNFNTCRLSITGGVRSSIYVKTYIDIEPEYLYDDPYFIEYVRGSALLSLGRMTNIFQSQLPGGITLGTSELKSEGKEMMKAVEDKIKAEQTVGQFLVFR